MHLRLFAILWATLSTLGSSAARDESVAVEDALGIEDDDEGPPPLLSFQSSAQLRRAQALLQARCRVGVTLQLQRMAAGSLRLDGGM